MKLLSNNITTSYSESGQQLITLTLTAKTDISDLKAICDKKKLIAIECKEHRKKRSLDANAYFHVLVSKIAEAMNLGEDETKVKMVLEYGSIMRDENGDKVGFKLPASVNVSSIYKYAKWFDERIEDGHKFNCYIIYEHTHKLDSKQMARLIDGTIYEAKELNIETMTPAEIAELKSRWKGV
jgi:hypothetical protein